jgi:hypothetical protein
MQLYVEERDWVVVGRCVHDRGPRGVDNAHHSAAEHFEVVALHTDRRVLVDADAEPVGVPPIIIVRPSAVAPALVPATMSPSLSRWRS